MQALIFADRKGKELNPISNFYCPALTPLANRPVLEYTLLDLSDAGISEVFIVLSKHADQLESYFESGSMWGIQIHYLLSSGEETPECIIERNRTLFKLPLLVLRGDMFRETIIKQFIHDCKHKPGNKIEAFIDGKPAGLCLVREFDIPLPGVAWPPNLMGYQPSVRYSDVRYSYLLSLEQFHTLSLELLSSKSITIPLKGRRVCENLTVDGPSHIQPNSCESATVLVGKNARIDSSVEVTGVVIVGDRSYVDHSAIIDNSIVMPNTYVGEGLEIKNSIVIGHHLIRIDQDCHIAIDDPLLLSDMEQEIHDVLDTFPERILGFFVLILSLPLWPLAWLASLMEKQQVRKTYSMINNKGNTIEYWQFATSIPALRGLPMIWLVLKNDINLFGSEPVTPGKKLFVPCWDTRCEQNSAGLLGPAQLDLPEGSSEEEIRMNEIVFTQERGLLPLVKRTTKALGLLFKPRAWRSHSAT